MEFILYVDGSYSMYTPDVVTGSAIILNSLEVPLIAERYIVKDKRFTAMNNVGAELAAALRGLLTCISLGGHILKMALNTQPKNEDHNYNITIVHDYVGIAELATESSIWKPKDVNSGTYYYKQTFNAFRVMFPNLKIKFVHVYGHTNIKWNEAADCIAGGGVPSYLTCPLQEVVVENEIF